MEIENQDQIENVRQYYEILRTRQNQIIEIIKDTTQMLSKFEAQQRFLTKNGVSSQQPEKKLESGMRLAFSMINALAIILDEQMKALNIWERMLFEEKTNIQDHYATNQKIQDYYEITLN